MSVTARRRLIQYNCLSLGTTCTKTPWWYEQHSLQRTSKSMCPCPAVAQHQQHLSYFFRASTLTTNSAYAVLSTVDLCTASTSCCN
jgi:hypothetical protein